MSAGPATGAKSGSTRAWSTPRTGIRLQPWSMDRRIRLRPEPAPAANSHRVAEPCLDMHCIPVTAPAVPAEIMAVANALLAEFAPGTRPPESVRASGVRPWARQVAYFDGAIAQFVEDEAGREGTSVVIGPPGVPGTVNPMFSVTGSPGSSKLSIPRPMLFSLPERVPS